MLSEEDMCGKGMMCQWVDTSSNKPGAKDKDEVRRKKHGWSKSGRGRHGERRGGGGGRWLSGHHHHHHHQQQQQLYHHHHPRRFHHQAKPRAADVVSLRPVNIKGNRARGMRAPKNTNQFLMHEKYQLMHMRSDSIGTDASSSGSDCSDAEFTDMDSYLGVLENARGALLDDAPNPHSDSPPTPVRVLPRHVAKRQQQLSSFFAFGEVFHQEESMQYFPSEDDVLQSEDFMQKDFLEFCGTLTEYTV